MDNQFVASSYYFWKIGTHNFGSKYLDLYYNAYGFGGRYNTASPQLNLNIIDDGNWHEIEIRGINLQSNSPTISIWIDGILVSPNVESDSGLPRPSNSSLHLINANTYPPTANQSDVALDELMIWKSALSDGQIAALQAATIDPTAGLAPDYHWTFNENNSGNTYADTGAVGGHDGTCNVATQSARVAGVFGNGFGSSGTPAPTTYTLTVSSSLGGFVSEPFLGQHVYNHGEEVNVIAEADLEYDFDVWTGTAPVNDPLAASTFLTMNDDYTLEANFQAKKNERKPQMSNQRIPVDIDVNVSVSVAQTLLATDMSLMAVLFKSATVFSWNRVKYYLTMAEYEADYAPGTAKWWAGQAFFAQVRRPKRLAVGLVATANQPGAIMSGPLSAADITAIEAKGTGVLTIPIAGSPVAITAIALTGLDTATKIAAAIAAGTNFPAGATCVANDDGSITISTGSATGATETIDYATAIAGADISAVARLTAATGAVLSQGWTHGALAVEAAEVQKESTNAGYPIYGWCIDLDYRDTSDQSDFADWVGGHSDNQPAISILASNDVTAYSGADETNIGYYANNSDNRFVGVVYSNNAQEYPDVSALAMFLSVDYSLADSTITGKFKDLSGCTPTPLTETQLALLAGRRINTLVLQGANAHVYREGVQSADTWFTDMLVNLHNFINELKVEVFNVFLRNGKVPYTVAGQTLICQACQLIGSNYIRNGTFADRQVADDTAQSGFTILKAFDVIPMPIYGVSAADRAARIAPPVQIIGYLSDAIHFVNINVNAIV